MCVRVHVSTYDHSSSFFGKRPLVSIHTDAHAHARIRILTHAGRHIRTHKQAHTHTHYTRPPTHLRACCLIESVEMILLNASLKLLSPRAIKTLSISLVSSLTLSPSDTEGPCQYESTPQASKQTFRASDKENNHAPRVQRSRSKRLESMEIISKT